MANELVIHYPAGATLYALLFDATGQIWNGAAFAAPGSASWTDYDIAMSEVATATGVYRASMPAAAAGVYGWVVRKQAGGSPAVTDIAVGSGEIRWTGTAEETVPASVNVTYSAGVALTGRLAEVTDLPAAAPSAATNATAAAAAILATPAYKIATVYGGSITISPETVVSAYMEDVSSTAQQKVANALKLAPAAGTPATGSVYDLLEAVKAVTDDIDVSAVTLATGNNAGELTFVVASVFDETLSGLTIPDDWTECVFSLKIEKDRDLDSESLVQIKTTNGGDADDGLLYLSRSAPVPPITKADASLTVTQAAGTVRIVVSAAAMAVLAGGRSSLDWDLKLFKPGGWSKAVTSGNARIDWTPTRTT